MGCLVGFASTIRRQMKMLEYYSVYILVASVITFFMYAIDKLKAKAGMWRIAERTLLLSSVLGGALGGSLAMLLFRHKTRHLSFKVINAAALILHILIGALLALAPKA